MVAPTGTKGGISPGWSLQPGPMLLLYILDIAVFAKFHLFLAPAPSLCSSSPSLSSPAPTPLMLPREPPLPRPPRRRHARHPFLDPVTIAARAAPSSTPSPSPRAPPLPQPRRRRPDHTPPPSVRPPAPFPLIFLCILCICSLCIYVYVLCVYMFIYAKVRF